MIEVFDAGGSLIWRGMKTNGLLRGRPAALGVVPGRGREGGEEDEEALKARET